MITYVSHIGITLNWHQTKLHLKKSNFQKYFQVNKIFNDKNKKQFLKKESKIHDIVFYKNKNWDFGLELINYEKNFINKNLNKINNHKIIDITFNKIDKLKNLTLYSSKIISDYNFFKDMNLLLDLKLNKNSFDGNLPSFGKKIVKVFIKNDISKNKLYLDDIGFNFISFFSTNLKDDIKKIKKKHINFISKIFKIKINNNNLKLVLVRSKGGLIIEFLEKI